MGNWGDDLDILPASVLDEFAPLEAEPEPSGLPAGVLRCRQCEALFLHPAESRATSYCSRACRQKAYRQRKKRRDAQKRALSGRDPHGDDPTTPHPVRFLIRDSARGAGTHTEGDTP